MSTGWALLASLALLAANAGFVAAEFALVAARRHRLESAAARGDRAAGAALRASRQLSLMLAAAQLGITACTLGLGALAKPVTAQLLGPALTATGLPAGAAAGIAMAAAVAVVGFLHIVVGEMAPKSWAITHPERSALLLARPLLGFVALVRPALAALNALANGCLRLMRVTPRDEVASAHGPGELLALLESSRSHGTLAAGEHRLLASMIAVGRTTVAQVMTPADQIATVPAAASARQVERRSRATGRSRLLVADPSGAMLGVVHVRDAALATTAHRPTPAADRPATAPDRPATAAVHPPVTAAGLMYPAVRLPSDTPVTTAVRLLRAQRAQLALVTAPGDPAAEPVGLVALEDLLEEIIGDLHDETAPAPAAVHGTGAPH